MLHTTHSIDIALFRAHGPRGPAHRDPGNLCLELRSGSDSTFVARNHFVAVVVVVPNVLALSLTARVDYIYSCVRSNSLSLARLALARPVSATRSVAQALQAMFPLN